MAPMISLYSASTAYRSGPSAGRDRGRVNSSSPRGGVAGNGNLYVADFYNQRVQCLRPDGTFVRQWGTTGKVGIGVGTFNYPTDVAIGPKGTLYVADG